MKELKLNNKKIASKITGFLKEEFRKRNKTKAILGLSGGVDSSVVAILCKKAKLDLYVVLMPYKFSHGKLSIKHSKKIIRLLSMPRNNVFVIDIAPSVDAQIKQLSRIIKLNEVIKGNLMARERMNVLYATANDLGGLVVGTSNLSEYFLGYFTLHGDAVSDIAPIKGLFKTHINSLARYLKVSDEILSKKPSADLWRGQTDEKELGFSYAESDPILYLYIYKKYPKEKIIKKLNCKPDLVKRVIKRLKDTDYKRSKVPSPHFYRTFYGRWLEK